MLIKQFVHLLYCTEDKDSRSHRYMLTFITMLFDKSTQYVGFEPAVIAIRVKCTSYSTVDRCFGHNIFKSQTMYLDENNNSNH